MCTTNHIMCSFWVIHCVFMFLLASTTQAQSGGKETADELALLSIKAQITRDPKFLTSSWNNNNGSLHFCHWKGVLCGNRHRRVTGLNLDSGSLEGSISPSIGNLSFLRIVNLSSNNLQGHIPPEMGRLFRLRVLNLSNNLLEGEIPGNLSHCTELRILGLNRNKLIGNPPKELGWLTQLVQLFIGYNNLTGTIPLYFGNLSSLQLLSAQENVLRGSIPDTLGSLKSLTQLSIFGNSLSGTVPPSIYNLSSLNIFIAARNQLEGSLPQNLGLTLPNIRVLDIWRNRLTGQIPRSISNASKLERLHLALNKFSPGLAVDFGNLKNLSQLGLYGIGLGTGGPNDLTFISTLANCSKLVMLYIDMNNFGGVLPNSIANLSTQLQRLSLSLNQVSGNIPAGIENLVGLNAVNMHYNQLTGTIPTSIGKLEKLQELDLGKNLLSGEIPSSSIGNLTLLNQLWLGENDFQGNIPSSLGNCKGLILLHLYGNNLSGSIPTQVIGLSSLSKSLDLSRNSLSGSIPQEVGNLKNLVELNLSHNQLSGEIPSSLGSCISLQYLYLDSNSIGGAIPQSLSSVRAIEELDLSHNNLSGEIPIFFANSSLLRNLNLSFNDLEGEVPTEGVVFQNQSAISVSGNNKLCGGVPALQLPACASNKEKKSLGLALIIVIFVGVLGIILTSSVLIICWVRNRKMRKQPSMASSSLGYSPRNISYDELFKATNGFSSGNLIGTGSSGSVYRGILRANEKLAAVKVLDQQNRRASRSFMAECKALRNIRHRNLVKIITACASVDFQGKEFKAIVYELMENGSLESWLHPVLLPQTGAAAGSARDEKPKKSLSLLQRLGIAIDVASALDYLHNYCHTAVIHCDLKPSNILLDSDMTAHVGDFGLARLLQVQNRNATKNSQSGQTSSVGLRGTIGYAAPEYGMGSEVSASGDVYSFGILLLELFTGKRPTDGMFRDGLNLHKLAKTALPERVMEIADQRLLSGVEEEELEEAALGKCKSAQKEWGEIHECLNQVIKIGVACSEESPRDRITIGDAARGLHLVKDRTFAV